MSDYEYEYLAHLNDLLHYGESKGDRTGTGTKSIFGHQMKIDLREGFPMLTTKKLFLRGIIHELLWFLNGDTNIKYLNDNGVHIWDEWADDKGDLGPVYGKQWRSWVRSASFLKPFLGDHDQIKSVMNTLKTNPDCRRMIVSAWNVDEINDMALAPCHTMFQFNTSPMPGRDHLNYNGESRYIDLHLYQRSADWFLGVPFNVASYSLLLMMVAKQVGMIPRHFIHSFGDTHLYNNHQKQAMEQLSRVCYAAPDMRIADDVSDIFSYEIKNFMLEGYRSHPAIKAPVAV